MNRTAVAITVVGLFAGCSAPPMTPTKTITLGAVIDRTGNNSNASWGPAIQLAQADMNAALKAANKNLEFAWEISDSKNDPATAVSAAQDLVTTRHAVGVVVDSSQNTIAVNKTNYDADMMNDVAVPILCGGCTSGSINNPTYADTDMAAQAANRNMNKWVFRGQMSTKTSSLVINRILLADGTSGDTNADGKYKLSIWNADESFGKSTATDLKTFAGTLHPGALTEDIVFPSTADVNTYNFAGDIDKLTNGTDDTMTADGGMGMAAGNPDAVATAVFASYCVAFVNAYKAAGKTQRVMHLQTCRIESVLQSLGSGADGMEGISAVVLDGMSGDLFAQEYKTNMSLDPVFRDAVYYDLATMLMLGTLTASSALTDPTTVTPASIRDALPKVADKMGMVVRPGGDEMKKAVGFVTGGSTLNYEGASGPLDWDANQSILARLAHFKVQGGKFVDQEKYDCVMDSANCPQVP